MGGTKKVGGKKKTVVSRSSKTKSQKGSVNTGTRKVGGSSKAKNQKGSDNTTTTVASVALNANDDLIAISSRPTLFNEETWWMLDLDNTNIITTRQGATPLAARCQREYQWDETKCRKVLKAYRQFLLLKKHFQDWDATILSPSGPVDQMWHQHLLDVTHYCHDTIVLCGHVVGHNPDGALDAAMKTHRTKTTRDALVEHFGSDFNMEMWLTQAELHVQEERLAVDNDGPITIRVRDQTGEETFFKVKRSTELNKLFITYAKSHDVNIESLVFLIDGEKMDGQLSAADYDMDDQDQLDVRLEQRGC